MQNYVIQATTYSRWGSVAEARVLLKHVFAQSGLDSSKSQCQPEFPSDVAEALPGCQAVQRHLSQRGVTRNAMHKQPLVLGSQPPRTSCGMVQRGSCAQRRLREGSCRALVLALCLAACSGGRGKCVPVAPLALSEKAALVSWGCPRGEEADGFCLPFSLPQKLAAECQSAGYPGTLIPYKCDLSNEEEILSMFSAIKTLHQGVDVCINNAGLARPEPLLSGRTEGWRTMIDVSSAAGLSSLCLLGAGSSSYSHL